MNNYNKNDKIIWVGIVKKQKCIIENQNSFELKDIFECGQCFRWNEQEDGSYTGIIKDGIINVKKENEDIIFTGRINTSEYIGKMDFTILTSISEGQPLTILEGYAAHKPAIATDVGNCRGLIYGEDDPYGPSGIVTHIMNVEEIKEAILFLANNPETCKEYGENGYKRLIRRYTIVDMKNTYDGIYTELSANMTD